MYKYFLHCIIHFLSIKAGMLFDFRSLTCSISPSNVHLFIIHTAPRYHSKPIYAVLPHAIFYTPFVSLSLSASLLDRCVQRTRPFHSTCGFISSLKLTSSSVLKPWPLFRYMYIIQMYMCIIIIDLDVRYMYIQSCICVLQFTDINL